MGRGAGRVGVLLHFLIAHLMEPLATPSYSANAPGSYGPAPSTTITIGDWLITYLITAVPLVGFVMLFVWAFGANTPPSKANWAKATLIIYVIFGILGLLFAGSFMALLMKSGGLNSNRY